MPVGIDAKEAHYPWLVRGALIAAVLVAGYFVREQIAGREFRIETETQRISLLEPPPLEEPEPEELEILEQPEEEPVELESNEVEDMPEELGPAPSDMLGLDGAGVAGSDAFGLAARRGGRDLLQSGDGGPLDCAWYETVLNTELGEILLPLLKKREALRKQSYSVVLRLWLAPDGRVDKYRLTSTGDAVLDAELRQAMSEFERVKTPPPPNLPQPVRIGLRCSTY